MLSTVDRLVRKLGSVNTLVEKLCERLLPHEVAHASGAGCIPGTYQCLFDWGCGVEAGTSYATYCEDGLGNLTYLYCGC